MPTTSSSNPRLNNNSVCEGTNEIIRLGSSFNSMLLPIWSQNEIMEMLVVSWESINPKATVVLAPSLRSPLACKTSLIVEISNSVCSQIFFTSLNLSNNYQLIPYFARLWITSYLVTIWYSPFSSFASTAPFSLLIRLPIFSTGVTKSTTG